MLEETKGEISEHNDVFFDLYRINIACYYNSKTILKLLNETTNISRNVNEVLQTYEENSNRIKEFDNKTYNDHIIFIKSVLSRLFQKEKQKDSFFKSFHHGIGKFSSWSSHTGQDLKSYIEDKYKNFPTIEEISSYIPIPTEKTMHETLETVEQGMRDTVDKKILSPGKRRLERRAENKRIESVFNTFVDNISKKIFYE
jgi:hypothetical protein